MKISIKENIVNESIAEARKRINFLRNEIFNNDPRSKQFEIHQKFAKFLEEKKGKDRTTQESIDYIEKLSKDMEYHEKRQKNYNSNKLMNELVALEAELRELETEKYCIEWRKA